MHDKIHPINEKLDFIWRSRSVTEDVDFGPNEKNIGFTSDGAQLHIGQAGEHIWIGKRQDIEAALYKGIEKEYRYFIGERKQLALV